MHRILGLGTYPIAQPIHGGQRRVTAFCAHYAANNVTYLYASVYERKYYAGAAVTAADYPSGAPGGRFANWPYMDDVNAGQFAASDPGALAHFVSLAQRFKPDVIQLEQPFMWPLAKRLLAEAGPGKVRLYYSSHNVEGPLKASILRTAGVSVAEADLAQATIAALEREIVSNADAIFAVSRSDANFYAAMGPSADIYVIPNGLARYAGPPGEAPAMFDGRKLLLFIGSAYPPNVDGFNSLVAERGLYFLPPEKHLAVCGGASEGIFNSPAYRADMTANGERVHFFPKISDGDLEALRRRAHAILLPITFGGGSNLKTAEALAQGAWVVATSTALRGFAAFRDASGVIVADTPRAFRRAIADVIRRPALALGPEEMEKRAALYWEGCFAASGFDACRLLTRGVNARAEAAEG
jgi:hypothetical protein